MRLYKTGLSKSCGTSINFCIKFVKAMYRHVCRWVEQKGHRTYKLYIPHTNFIFPIQNLYSPYKIYIPQTNFIFLIQTFLSKNKLYISLTNVLLKVNYRLGNFKISYKVYIDNRLANFIGFIISYLEITILIKVRFQY